MRKVNNTPEKLFQVGILDSLGLVVLRLDGHEGISCTTGKGSLIDYALRTKGYEVIVESFEIVYDVPCRPHCGVRLYLQQDFVNMMVDQITRPKGYEMCIGFVRNSHDQSLLIEDGTDGDYEAEPQQE